MCIRDRYLGPPATLSSRISVTAWGSLRSTRHHGSDSLSVKEQRSQSCCTLLSTARPAPPDQDGVAAGRISQPVSWQGQSVSRSAIICGQGELLSLIHISEPTRLLSISYAVFCLKKKKKITLQATSSATRAI
eukprot:TRINITY_DN3997_c0_g1_i4.p1 TRINITY_DN3997_c0_g1~~TRINITY_DN3997_c0_g1_i4.p1  ORF type:complete len:133 (+),score=24.01 TRINITY_DN3997_c0_g1_i4:161-559(+)